MSKTKNSRISRRSFLGKTGAASLLFLFPPWTRQLRAAPDAQSKIFQVARIPSLPFTTGGNRHAGVDALLSLMGGQELKFFRSGQTSELAGPDGIIAADDVVLFKVNAQWKYRGCTNSDVIRGLVQRVLEHPDGFSGEVVIIENGQGRGSLNCNTSASYGNSEVHANAVNEQHSFLYLVSQIFHDPRVSAFLLDSIRSVFIAANDHQTNGYRRYENVSYPCFTSAGGRRVELREGIWTGSAYRQNLKLINVPVLKHHDSGGSEITAALKHMYGLVSMTDGNSPFRHYTGLGETCGKMMVSVRPPALNIVDAIWVSHLAITGYPASSTKQANVLLAAQDPVALDYWAAKNILYPIDQNPRHHPSHVNIQRWLAAAETIINQRGGLYHPEWGIMAGLVTRDESRMAFYSAEIGGEPDQLELTSPNGGQSWPRGSTQIITWRYQGNPGTQLKILLLKGGLIRQTLSTTASRAAGAFSWTVPGSLPKANDYLIRIISRQNPAIADTSDRPFSIGMAPPGSRITLASPNGGESWPRGSKKTLTWTYSGQIGNTVKIVLFKGRTKIQEIASAAALGTAGSGSFIWTIPSRTLPGNDYYLRIRSVRYNDCRDENNRPFTITR